MHDATATITIQKQEHIILLSNFKLLKSLCKQSYHSPFTLFPYYVKIKFLFQLLHLRIIFSAIVILFKIFLFLRIGCTVSSTLTLLRILFFQILNFYLEEIGWTEIIIWSLNEKNYKHIYYYIRMRDFFVSLSMIYFFPYFQIHFLFFFLNDSVLSFKYFKMICYRLRSNALS